MEENNEVLELKDIVKEELSKSLEVLKVKGIQLGKEAAEDVALEMSQMMARVAVRSENKVDDFYLSVQAMLEAQIDKIDGKEG